MKKTYYSKGFSLTELIAVIVIITLLVTIGTSTFIGVRKSILTKEYDNLVIYLETKASEYANDTNITRVSVDDLIKEGYVKADDDNYVYNPINKEKMNCYIINSVYDTEAREFVSTLDKNYLTEDGKCKEYTKTSNLEICKFNSDGSCTTFNNTDWFDGNITLGVLYDGSLIGDDQSYSWVSTLGLKSDKNTLETKTEKITQDEITCKVIFNDMEGTAKKSVNIDIEAPGVAGVSIENHNIWVKEQTKNVTINLTDNGSGVDSIYVTNESLSDCHGLNFDKKVTGNTYVNGFGLGEYFVCVKDKVGNVSSVFSFEVEKIDTTPSMPIFSTSDGNKASGSNHTSDYTLSWISTNEGSKDLEYYYGTSKNNMTKKGNNVSVSKDSYSVTYYVKACTKSGLCSDINSYIANVDNIKPSITINSSGSTCSTSHTISATLTDNESGVVGYAVTTSSAVPTSWKSVTKTNSYNLSYTINSTTTKEYYIHVKDGMGNVDYKSYGKVCVDTTPPTAELNPTFSCSDGLRVYVDCEDNIGTCDYTWKHTTSSSEPSSFTKSSSKYKSSALDGKNYLWVNVCDSLNNCRVYNEYLDKCDLDDSSDSGDSGSTTEEKTRYSAYNVCANTNSCSSNGYTGGGECAKVNNNTSDSCYGNTYHCYCCKSTTTFSSGYCWR